MDRRGPILSQLFTHAQSSPSEWDEGNSVDEVCTVYQILLTKLQGFLDWRSLGNHFIGFAQVGK